MVWLTKVHRWRAAMIVAVVYAICVLTPTAAMAFGDSTHAAHCVAENHDAIGKRSQHGTGEISTAHNAHVHDSDINDKHPKSDTGAPSKGDCCGLMCLFAMPGGTTAEANFVGSPSLLPSVKSSIDGVGPGLLFKPPKS